MEDEDKTREQSTNEFVELRQRIAELEKSENQCRQAEKALREAEAKYRSIFENAVEGIFQIALDGHIIAANQTAARMLGYDSPKELIAEVTDIRQLYIDLNRRDELIHLMQTKGVVTGFEVQIRRKDGSVIWTSASTQVSRDESGRIVGFVGMGIDITEHKQAEEKLRESEIRYRTLFEQSPDGVLIIDPQTAIAIDFNEVAHRQLGYTREEFKRLRIFDYEAKEKLEETKAHIEKVLREGRDDFETQHRTKDGEIRNVLVTIQTIELSGRIFFHCIFRDVTEPKRAEEALRESEMSYRTLFERAGDAILILEA
ncbi:MAG TPA: PAS domain S-box protein, partial [Thermodesulfovibrionales bacterium]|nr:PAS domain S-box protein [Thermodesulfovibrionales bacterium]